MFISNFPLIRNVVRPVLVAGRRNDPEQSFSVWRTNNYTPLTHTGRSGRKKLRKTNKTSHFQSKSLYERAHTHTRHHTNVSNHALNHAPHTFIMDNAY